MDNQNPTPKHVPTEEEIARLEREAAEALRRGEPIQRREPLPETAREEIPAEAVPTDYVPYVDDVPEPEPAPRPAQAAADAAPEEDDDDDEEYIPGEMEKRINAMDPAQWKRWQILGGAAAGLAVIAALFSFGQELSTYGLLLAVILAMFLPRYLERAWRCKLGTARKAMIISMLVGLIAVGLIIGIRTGFKFTNT